MLIYHLAVASDWAAAQSAGEYRISTRGRTLEQEGFIHASRAEQWRGVRQRFYADVTEPLVLLSIDTDLLDSEVREEQVGEETFPHVYGPIVVDAVVRVERLGGPSWRFPGEVPVDLDPTVVTIGNFDGVHLGHRAVISRARAIADERSRRVVAVIFDPHPMAVLRPEHAPVPLTDIDDRCRLLRDAGVDDVLVIEFSRDIASWTPEEFIERVLVYALHADAVVVGANFRFGNRASGDVGTLREHGGFTVEGVALDGGPQVWSSTYVRTCLVAGDVEGAAEALGRPYAVTGHVVRGDRRGRELGFPTANVPPHGVAVPADGVYAGRLRRLDEPGAARMPAAISVGTNPTFDGERERRVEAYVLDRDDLELYDAPVEVSFVARIRGMVAFDDVEALVAEMHRDVDRARAALTS